MGLFGTAVGSNPAGKPCILVYANSRGRDYLETSGFSRFSREEGLPFFIVEIDPIQFIRSECCVGGTRISTQQQGAPTGTLGAWLQRNPPGFVGVSNNHVLADFDRIPVGSYVIQLEQNQGGQVIGRIDGKVNLRPKRVNYVDVAWFTPNDPNIVRHDIGMSGLTPKGEEEDIAQRVFNELSVPVWYWGSSSGFVEGMAVAGPGYVYIEDEITRRVFRFDDQIQLDLDHIESGDSGSLFLTSDNNKIGGMLFAKSRHKEGGGKIGYANPWQSIKRETRLKFLY